MTLQSTFTVDLTEADQFTVCRYGEDRVLICLGHPKASHGKVMITLPLSRLADLATPLSLIQLERNLSALGDGVEKLGDVMLRAVDTINAQRLAERAGDVGGVPDPKVVSLAERRPS